MAPYIVFYNDRFIENNFPGICGKGKLAWLKFVSRKNASEIILNHVYNTENERYDSPDHAECSHGKMNVRIIPEPWDETLDEFKIRKLEEDFFRDKWGSSFHKERAFLGFK